MPRKSLEQRSAELYRIGNKPPQPPANLTQSGRNLWRSITGSKSADYWTPAITALLERFVRTAEHADRIVERLAELPVGDPEALQLGRQMTAVNASLGGLAVKLRLSAQNEIGEEQRARMTERGTVHELIGGKK